MDAAIPELYTLEAEDGRLRFVPLKADAQLPAQLSVVQRLGDPALLQCAVLRREGAPGGVFRLEDTGGPLFAAIAASNLTFALGLGYFGELTANARYGVDVFENMEEPDD